MSRATLTTHALVANSGVADPTGTASVAGAGNGFTIAASTVPENLWLRAANATGAAATLSVLAGSLPLAPSSGLGAVTVSVAASGTEWIGPFDSSRVVQNDGSLAIETSAVMTVTAFTLEGRRV